MPTYEYECRKCGHVFEKFQSMSAKPLQSCPVCRGRARRQIGRGAGLLFKGSGFYVTDYRSAGYRKAAQAESSGAATPASAPAAKPEAKPAGGDKGGKAKK